MVHDRPLVNNAATADRGARQVVPTKKLSGALWWHTARRVMGIVALRRRWIIFVLGVSLAMVLCECPRTARSSGTTLHDVASFSRPIVNANAFSGHGELAFVSDRELYVLDGATGGLRQVTAGSPTPSNPSFSHDGRWLAFLRVAPNSNGGGGTLWIARGDGADAHKIARVPPAYPVPNSGAPVYSWSPSVDELVVTTGPVSGGPLVPRDVWIVRAAGRAHRLLGRGYASGAIWSPNGHEVAVIWGAKGLADQVIETLRPTGGTPTVWFGTDGRMYYLAGWAQRFGILVWDDRGNGGPSVENYGLPLDAMSHPRRPLAPLVTAPLFQPPALAIGPHGELAVVAIEPEKSDSAFEGEKFVWFDKTIESCSPANDSCRALSDQPSSVSLNPAISPADGALSFVKAPQSDEGIVPIYSPLQTGTEIAGWYAAHSLWLLSPGSSTPTEISGTAGAADPIWSSRGTGIVFVKNQALWMTAAGGGEPVEVASSLDFPATSSSGTYLFGYVDWASQFAWSG
jgi:TolB protein